MLLLRLLPLAASAAFFLTALKNDAGEGGVGRGWGRASEPVVVPPPLLESGRSSVSSKEEVEVEVEEVVRGGAITKKNETRWRPFPSLSWPWFPFVSLK